MSALGEITAEQLMSDELLTVCETWSIQKLIHFFNKNKISGAPVTSQEGDIIGCVSRGDIIQFDENPHHDLSENPMAQYYLNTSEGVSLSEMELPDANQHINHLVSEIMTTDIIWVDAHAPITTIASVMATHRIHRVFIKKDGKISGAITTLDILGIIGDAV